MSHFLQSSKRAAGVVSIDAICTRDKPNKRETGTVHKPLPKHPGNPPKPRMQIRNFNLRRALLSRVQQTAKLSCRRGVLAWLSGTRSAEPCWSGQWNGEGCSVQPLPSVGLAPANISNSTWKKGGALRRVKWREGEACCGKYIRILQTSIFLNLEKIAGKIKFTGEQRE